MVDKGLEATVLQPVGLLALDLANNELLGDEGDEAAWFDLSVCLVGRFPIIQASPRTPSTVTLIAGYNPWATAAIPPA